MVPERHSGQVGVYPPERPAILWCAESASKDVVEGVQVPVPGVAAQQPRELTSKAVEIGKVRAVDNQNRKSLAGYGHT